ncbi:MAG: hypothetical protein LBJ11_09695 [Oscillospiraceae bacterium]|jgi:muramoyltetrapeptide carboxypeptidase LdcA involved in peptidoglycan recycling|nr:hypothetical protein [Oscillospiraceae bacterium]
MERAAQGAAIQPNRLLTLREGSAEGRLIGGNLNTMLGIFGSPYLPEIRDGDILLLEDKHLGAEEVEREFAQLALCGVSDRIGGLLLGKHIDYDDRGTGRRPHYILWEIAGAALERRNCPVLADFDCSHAMPMLTLPLGVRVRLDAGAQRLTLLEEWIGP